MEKARRAQQRLVDRGFAIAVDGDFGGKSMAALMSWVGGRPTISALRGELADIKAELKAAVNREVRGRGVWRQRIATPHAPHWT